MAAPHCLLFGLLLAPYGLLGQTMLKGQVNDREGNPIFAANVYIASDSGHGTVTDFNGNFQVNVPDRKKDTLTVSYIGYQEQKMPLSAVDMGALLEITLWGKASKLQEIIVKYTDPISEQFSVVKMDMLKDVYLNPISQGDPLKAITFLPSSTTTDETVNPSFRGSSAGRTRVMYNGVPIINPVRATNLSNQGFFSLLNPELIDKQYVYASNPPLTFGNTSAGLVEIATKRKLEKNQLQLSLGLASTGFLLSQRIQKGPTFLQAYGNFQFSDAFVGIQSSYLPTIQRFAMQDAGLNVHTVFGKKTSFNSFNYYIDEKFHGKNIEAYTYTGGVKNGKKRFITINNLEIYGRQGTWSINSGASIDETQYRYGNTHYHRYYDNVFTGLNYKWFILKNTDIQFGISHDYHHHFFRDSVSTFYYALSPEVPNTFSKHDIANHIVEAYAYTLWNMNRRWSLSFGMRSNIPVHDQTYYFSSQMSIKFKPNPKHILLLSGGKYHNYTTPTSFSISYRLLWSYQVALDYTFRHKNTSLKAAAYFKHETGDRIQFIGVRKINTFGVEFFIEHNFLTYFNYTLANSFIHQRQTIENRTYPGTNDFAYLIKTSLRYANPRLFTVAVTYIGRPGKYYTSIKGGTLNTAIGYYEPTFGDSFYDSQYDGYHQVSVNISKYIPLKKHALIFFASVNNVLNRNNQQTVQYNADYTKQHFDDYQLRNIYVGMVWRFDY